MKSLFEHSMERSDSSHAILESESRKRKANKIKEILSVSCDLSTAKVLDIGTGSGHIAHELSKSSRVVHSVDIVDERKIKDGYDFTKVDNESLPFSDDTFDVVVTNHVIEHTPNQQKHAQEVKRVLKPGGIIYLATPNKLWFTDPHYKLPFISWLPRRISKKYLKLAQNSDWDIYPLSHFGVEKYFGDIEIKNALPLLIRNKTVAKTDELGLIVKLLRKLPKAVDGLSKFYSPTLIYTIYNR